MNNKEMLQGIKKRVDRLVGFESASDNDLYYISKKHIDWLIEQAEKVEQLQQEIVRLTKERDQYFDDKVLWSAALKIKDQQLQQAQAKAERYEKALREIANEQEVGEGDFNADDVANNLIAAAKEALENKFL